MRRGGRGESDDAGCSEGDADRGFWQLSGNVPIAFSHYEAYHYEWFARQDAAIGRAVVGDPVGQLESIMSPAGHRAAYLILTRSQAVEIDTTGLLPRRSLTQVEHALVRSGRFGVVYISDDAVILTLQAQ